MKNRSVVRYVVVMAVISAALLMIFVPALRFRFDMSADKRHSISASSKRLLAEADKRMSVKLYLTGSLDADMLRLSRGTEDLIAEFNRYTSYPMNIERVDPNASSDEDERYAFYDNLEIRGLRGMSVAKRKRNGTLTEQIVFPWAEVCSDNDTVAVPLILPSANMRGEVAVNAAIEDLEYRFIDAIRILNISEVKKIAFLEGHDEMDESEVYDACDALNRYFQIDRGVLGSDVDILDDYAAVVVAKPAGMFSETDKFILDRYIMNGGRVLWLLEGVRMSNDMLSSGGVSPLMAMDNNLADQLFRYGVRITSSLVEDMQCAYMPVNVSRPGTEPHFEAVPWFFSPLLQTSPYHPITKGVASVRADYASAIEFVGDTVGVNRQILLATSNASHITSAPSEINVANAVSVEPEKYFNTAFIPMAVALEGRFKSVYANRMPPEGIEAYGNRPESVHTRMIVVADGDVIRNDIERHPEGLAVIPLGYDRITGRTHGNKDFIVNSMLYLTDDDGLMELRNKKVTLRLLNRAMVTAHRDGIVIVSILMPLLLLAFGGMIYLFARRQRYVK